MNCLYALYTHVTNHSGPRCRHRHSFTYIICRIRRVCTCGMTTERGLGFRGGVVCVGSRHNRDLRSYYYSNVQTCLRDHVIFIYVLIAYANVQRLVHHMRISDTHWQRIHTHLTRFTNKNTCKNILIIVSICSVLYSPVRVAPQNEYHDRVFGVRRWLNALDEMQAAAYSDAAGRACELGATLYLCAYASCICISDENRARLMQQ